MRIAIVAASLLLLAAPALAETALVVIGDGATAADLDRIEAEVRAGAGLPLQPPDVTRGRLAPVTARGSCDLRSVDCLVQLGVVCGTDQLLLADVVQDEGARAVVLLLVDVNAGKAKKRARAATVADALGALGRASAGTTKVSIAGPPGTTVAVDGAPGAKVPFTRTDLAPGTHTLRVTVPGKPWRDEKIDVLLGEETKVALDAGPVEALARDTTPAPAAVAPPQEASSLPIVGAIAGGVAVVAGGVVGGVGLGYYAAREQTITALRQHEVGAADKLANDPSFPQTVATARQEFERADADWEEFGPPLVATGTLLIGVGLGAGIASMLWMTE